MVTQGTKFTEVEPWAVGALKLAVERGRIENDGAVGRHRAIRIPPYQRRLVWSEDKKRALIDSVLADQPIGALLCAVASNGFDLQLIDGQQRTNTLIEHVNNPLTLWDPGEPVVEQLLTLLEHELTDSYQSTLRVGCEDAVHQWKLCAESSEGTCDLRKRARIDIPTFETAHFQLHLAAALPEAVLDDATYGIAVPSAAGAFVGELEDELNITQREVPVLVYSGPQTDLPEIFNRLNTGGKPLSPLETFAAKWSYFAVVDSSQRIRKAVSEYYRKRIDSTDDPFDITGLEDDGTPTLFTLFDWVNGLSQSIATSEPWIAKDAFAATFNALSLMLGTHLDHRGQIYESPFLRQFEVTDQKVVNDARARAQGLTGGEVKAVFTLNAVEAALRRGISLVREALAPHVVWQFGPKGPHAEHPALMIASMIASAALHSHDPKKSFAPKPTAKLKELLALSLPQHYLVDQLRRTWKGSLWAYATERVWTDAEWDPSGKLQDGSLSTFYLEMPTRQAIVGALRDYYEERVVAVRHKDKAPPPTQSDRVLLRMVANSSASAGQKGSKLDLDHIFPGKRLVDLIRVWGVDGVPITTAPNLAPLKDSDNRRKRDQTLEEYIAVLDKPKKVKFAALVKEFTGFTPSELSIPKDAADHDALTREAYVAILDDRWRWQVSTIGKSLGLVSDTDQSLVEEICSPEILLSGTRIVVGPSVLE